MKAFLITLLLLILPQPPLRVPLFVPTTRSRSTIITVNFTSFRPGPMTRMERAGLDLRWNSITASFRIRSFTSSPLWPTTPRKVKPPIGYGDTEVGIKYRLLDQTDTLPMIGVFPLVEIPTGDEDKGLGNGKAQYFSRSGSRKTSVDGPLTEAAAIGSIPVRGTGTIGSPAFYYSTRFPRPSTWVGNSFTRRPTQLTVKTTAASTLGAAFLWCAIISSCSQQGAD